MHQSTIGTDQPCLPGYDLRSSDLCAQWKAADAASESAAWTARNFWLSLLGTVVGAGTLLAAFMAAIYAKHAAKEARRSADIAKDAFIASERAWLTVDLHAGSDLTFHPTGGCSLFVYLTIKNIGRTPALNVHTSMEMVPMRQDHVDEVEEFARRERKQNRSWSRTLLPGDSYDRKWGLGLDDHSASPYGTIFGSVTYEILPDRSIHQTTFCYIVGRGEVGSLDGFDIPQDDVSFTVTSGGFAD
ncbi:hypothetical protein D3C87_503070 [compost metagenome]